MNKIVTSEFGGFAQPVMTAASPAVTKMVKAWEAKNAKRAVKGAGGTLMAVSLAACGGSSDDDIEIPDLTTAVMTVGVDDIPSAGLVQGLISGSGAIADAVLDLSTYNLGDEVAGNGSGTFELTVGDFGSPSAYTAPAVTMSGRDTFVIEDKNGEGELFLDAENFDDSIQLFSLNSQRNADFEVDVINLVANAETVTIELNPGAGNQNSILRISDAELEGFTSLDAQVSADGDNTTSSTATVSTSAGVTYVDLNAGIQGAAEVGLELLDTFSGDVSVGPLTLDIAADSAKQGEVEFFLAYAAAGTNSATVDDLSVVSFEVNLGVQSDGSFVTNDALNNGNSFGFDVLASVTVLGSTDAGAATVGDVTVSDINVTGMNGSVLESINFDVDAFIGVDGAATIGDTEFGDITVTLGKDALAGEIGIALNAVGEGEGDVSVGSTTIGDVAVTLGDDGRAGDNEFDLTVAAFAATGSASVGAVLVGDIAYAAGDDFAGEVNVAVEVDAFAVEGDATITSVSVGRMSAIFEGNGDADADVEHEFHVSVSASADDGDASVGNITLGGADFAGGDDQELHYHAEIDIQGNSATLGNVSIGSFVATAGDDAEISATVSVSVTGFGVDSVVSVGSITIGASNISAGDDASIDYSAMVYLNGDEVSVGNVSFGAFSATAGDNADIDIENNVEVYGNEDGAGVSLGNIRFGAINVTVGDFEGFAIYGMQLENEVSVTAGSGDVSVGAISVGDVSFAMGALKATGDVWADLQILHVDVDADDAEANVRVGAVVIGDISIDAGAGVNVNGNTDAINYNVDFDGNPLDATLGNITVGDMDLTIDDGATIDFDVRILADGLDLGDMTFGDTTITGTESNGYVDVAYYIGEDGELDEARSVGDVTFGDISIQAAAGQWVNWYAQIGATDTVGDVELGDITASVGVNGSFDFSLIIDAEADVTIGDISLTRVLGSYDEAFEIYIDVAGSGDVTIGDITVSGAMYDGTVDVTGPAYLPSGEFDLTNILSVDVGTGDVVIGDVDYSGVSVTYFDDGTTEIVNGTTTIDVSGFDGASVITAAQTDTIIFDNDGQNTIILGDGADTVVLNTDNDGLTLETADRITNIDLDDVGNLPLFNGVHR